MRFSTAVLAGVFSLILVAGHLYYPANAQKKISGRLPNYWNKLGLSKAQTLEIYKIQGDYKAKIDALEKQIEDLKAQERQDMVKILSDEQKGKLREIYLKKFGLDPSGN